ncbi:Gfo/Idh/MocA family protein [Actinophytocola gossypii]|uniref:Gfo/Idh/MocA family oxidoreductase n=1 Tax=Actinophytocola gossypii TaxID=2812003 RepID=A0ABT2J4F0_9PSEU|nr:Gfo/Idh/MocA family oxidoreductase [Actinophytocola gossypii]MCT2582469.1 Gfo/Idh/MocA family oxidoreductase [Actinophytocola gossypii]
MNDTTLRMGLVGAGPWAHRVHGPGIAAHPGTDLVAVWARRPEAASSVAAVAGGATPMASFDDLLATVDAVTFAVPPQVQAPLALRAIEAGKHVVLEKPLASTVEEAGRLVDAAERVGVATLMVLTFRYAPEVAGWLDDVRRVGGWHGGAARWISSTLLDMRYEASPWRHDGGALADIGPHTLDLLDAALGPVTRVLHAHFAEPGAVWHLLLGHESGATSTATLTMHTPAEPQVNDFTVFGEHGYRHLDASGDPGSRYAALLDAFIDLVRTGGTEHPTDIRRGLHLQRLLGAVQAALVD